MPHEDASHSHGLQMRSRISVGSPDMKMKRRLAMVESVSEPSIVELEVEESAGVLADEVRRHASRVQIYS